MLKFICGTMGSAKTASALMKYFELKSQGFKTILMKPAIDTRDGSDIVKSRIGLEERAIVFDTKDDLSGLFRATKLHTIIIDEAHERTINSDLLLGFISQI